MKSITNILLLLFLFISTPVYAGSGNSTNDSFNKAKRALEQQVYFDHRITLYCEAKFDERGNIELPVGFIAEKYKSRAKRLEWEHVVPAENFGRTFVEWREGDPQCVNRKGNKFKGRKCAEKVNMEYRYMQSDMYNLYPAIGAVNAARQNYNFTQLPKNTPPAFGSCPIKIEGNKVEPPEYTRGVIARTYKYMAAEYPRFELSSQQRKLMDAWDKMYPPDEWECKRANRIENIQGNENTFVKTQCLESKLRD